MVSAIRDINIHEEDLAEALREAIGESNLTWADVAHSLGKSERQIRYYGSYGRYDINAQSNRLKAHEIRYLPEPLKSIILKFITEESDNFDLNGEVDDEWANLSELFGAIHLDFREGKKYSRIKEDCFMKIAEKMFAEWRAKDE